MLKSTKPNTDHEELLVSILPNSCLLSSLPSLIQVIIYQFKRVSIKSLATRISWFKVSKDFDKSINTAPPKPLSSKIFFHFAVKEIKACWVSQPFLYPQKYEINDLLYNYLFVYIAIYLFYRKDHLF